MSTNEQEIQSFHVTDFKRITYIPSLLYDFTKANV